MKYLKSLILVVFGALLFTACDNEKDASIQVGDTELSVEIENEMNDFEKQMEEWGRKIDAELASIESKMENAGDEMEEEFKEQQAEWREMRRELDVKMKNFNNNAKDNWSQFKADTRAFFDDLGDAFDS